MTGRFPVSSQDRAELEEPTTPVQVTGWCCLNCGARPALPVEPTGACCACGGFPLIRACA